ncbi:MAG: YggS family pyridoxal phosphate-dependent enzyme, partial [Luteimonas sp.]
MQRLDNAARTARRPPVGLLAVSKTRPATDVSELAQALRLVHPQCVPAFGENYVQEAQAKQAALDGIALEWHLIGHLQSNKASDAAAAFDWVQTVDRVKLIAALAAHR